MMKYIHVFIPLLVLIFLPTYSFSSDLGSLRTSLVQGDVLVKTENASEWMSLLLNMPLMEGDLIDVPDSGRLELQTRDGSLLRFDENSSLKIQAKEGSAVRISLTRGQAYLNLRGDPDSTIRLETPLSFLRVSGRSALRVDILKAGSLRLSVFSGTVLAAGRNEMIEVGAGETLTLGSDYYADLSPLGPSDEWEQWNRRRDELFEEKIYSRQYLPEELRAYSYEFDAYGKWVYAGGYGYVWRPGIVLSSAWTPYRAGRWRWIGSDYVWVSYEPWGWVPYHYGRWDFTVSLGWFWVPPAHGVVYWGPGYVGWVHTPQYVAWIPLAPGDIYYGYGYYGPGSVNVLNINILLREKKRRYKHRYVDRAVTVVQRDSFSSAKHVPYETEGNPFVRVLRGVKKAGEKTDGFSYLPLVKRARPDHVPVERITDRRYRTQRRSDVSSQERMKAISSDLRRDISYPQGERESIGRKRKTHELRDGDVVRKQRTVQRRSGKGSIRAQEVTRHGKYERAREPIRERKLRSPTAQRRNSSRREAEVRNAEKYRGYGSQRISAPRSMMKGPGERMRSSQRNGGLRDFGGPVKVVRFNSVRGRR